jgi:hypothetical protein
MTESFTSPTFYETQSPDGDVLPAQTGPNSPMYSNLSPEQRAAGNYQDLVDMHYDIAAPENDSQRVNHAAELLRGKKPVTPVEYPSTATTAYLDGRERILGSEDPKKN